MARKKKKETNKMLLWAEREVNLAFRNHYVSGGDKDYELCYESALSAFRRCVERNPNNLQFMMTSGILDRLIHGLPLSPITDDDFVSDSSPRETVNPWYADELPDTSPDCIQCSRCESVFKIVDKDGNVSYTDFNRAYFVNIDCPDDMYSSDTGFLDEMYPVTMPYYPSVNKFVIYERKFLADESNIDWEYDTIATLFMITPDGKKVDLDIYRTVRDGNLIRISKYEYGVIYEKYKKFKRKEAEALEQLRSHKHKNQD